MNTKSMDAKYVILKSMRAMTGDPFAQPFGVTAGTRELVTASSDFAIEVNRFKKKNLAERSRDATVAAIAPVMRMKLIEPHGTTALLRDCAAISQAILLAVAGALPRCLTLAVLVPRRVRRLALHPATTAKLPDLLLRSP